MRRFLVLGFLVLGACGAEGLEDPTFPTGSSTVVASAMRDAVFAVNVDEGTVSRVLHASNEDGREVTEVRVGAEPTRIARANGRLLVTLRGDSGLAVLDEDTLAVERVVPTGLEPYGVVATEDGARVYVAASMSGWVEERDGATLELLRTFEMPGTEPRWLAVHPGGRTLYVGVAFGGAAWAIDLDSGQAEPFALPRVQMERLDGELGGTTLFSRVTGDPAVTPDGRYLAIPALYVELDSPETAGFDQAPAFPYYGTDRSVQPGRFNGVLAVFPVNRSGQPGSKGKAVLLASSLEGGRVARSYPTSVTPTPDRRMFLVTMEASQSVIAVDATRDAQGAADELARRHQVALTTGAGPRGVAISNDDEAWVHGFLGRSLTPLDADVPRGMLRDAVMTGLPAGYGYLSGTLYDQVPIAIGSLDPQVELGRAHFYSAISSEVGAGGVSCSTCHFEGRNDGLTWNLVSGPRNTPSLAGVISETAPVTWSSDVPTVADEAMFTAQLRMGGGFDLYQAQAVEAFIDWTRLPQQRAGDAAAIARGQVVFERDDVACATCHTGAALTDNEAYTMFGERVRTRTLLGIAASAPYLHDGRLATLRDVVLASRSGVMGDTSMLSEAEIDDLVAYLESL